MDKLTELRDVIAAHLSGTVSERAILVPLRDFAHEARSRGERAEQVVIVLKRAWESLQDERQSWPRDAQLHLLDRLVTHCIDDYYAMQPDADQDGGSRGLVR